MSAEVLYSGRCFLVLKEFVPLFEELAKLGCPSPVPLSCLQAFSQVDPAALVAPSLDGFAGGDVGMRIRFFTSTLYKDFSFLRSDGLLQAARSACNSAARSEAIAALRSAVANTETDEGDHKKFGDWAHSLFAVGDPALALAFALGGDAIVRVRFALSFPRLEGDVKWDGALVLVDSEAEVPATLSPEAFLEVIDTAVSAGLRKAVTNPLAAAIWDFHQDLLQGASSAGDSEKPAWQHDLLMAAAAVKLGARSWRSEFDCDRVPPEQLMLVARGLQKLWALKGPVWFFNLREKAVQARAAEKERAALAASAAPGTPIETAAAPGTPIGAVAPEFSAVALGTGVIAPDGAPAPETGAAILAAAPARAKGAAKVKAKADAKKDAAWRAPFVTGDQVRLSGSVKKAFRGLEGRLDHVGSSEVRVCITTPGPHKGKVKRVSTAAAVLVKSPAAEAAAVPSAAPAASAAAAPLATPTAVTRQLDAMMVAELLPRANAAPPAAFGAGASSSSSAAPTAAVDEVDPEEAELANLLFED